MAIFHWQLGGCGCGCGCSRRYSTQSFQVVSGTYSDGAISVGGIVTVIPTPLADYGFYSVTPIYQGDEIAEYNYDVVFGGYSFTLHHAAGSNTQSVYFGDTFLGDIGYVSDIENAYILRVSSFGDQSTATGFIRWTPFGNYTIYVPNPNIGGNPGIFLTPVKHADYRPGIKNVTDAPLAINAIDVYPEHYLGTEIPCTMFCHCPEYEQYCSESIAIDVTGFSGFAASPLNRRWTLNRKAYGTLGQAGQWESEEITYTETVQVKTNGTDANGVRFVYFPDAFGKNDLQEVDVSLTFKAKMYGSVDSFYINVRCNPIVFGTNRTTEPYPYTPASPTYCACERRNWERWYQMTNSGYIDIYLTFSLVVSPLLYPDPYSERAINHSSTDEGAGYFYYQNGVLLPGEPRNLGCETYPYKYGYYDEIHELEYTRSCGNLPDRTCTYMACPRTFIEKQLVAGLKNSCSSKTAKAALVEA